MRRRGLLAGFVAAPLVLAGCASATAGAAPVTTSAAAVTSDAAALYASPTPPAAARMICSDETRGEVGDAVGIDSVPAPQSSWAEHVYTCAYPLPMGPLVLSVTVAPSDAAAGGALDAMRTDLGAARAEPGFGQRAYSSDTGVLVAVKDNMVLRVDPTGLPDDLGAAHLQRIDLARVIAAAIFDCWTGNG